MPKQRDAVYDAQGRFIQQGDCVQILRGPFHRLRGELVDLQKTQAVVAPDGYAAIAHLTPKDLVLIERGRYLQPAGE